MMDMKENNLVHNKKSNYRDLILNLSKNWSIETTPSGAKKIDDFSKLLSTGKSVNVTFLPNTDPNDTIDVCEKLYNQNMNPVPHIAARSIKCIDDLDIYLSKLKNKANISEILVIGGSLNNPVGDFQESMQILNTGLLQKYNITKVGIAGHPEGSPDISNQLIEKALIDKYEWSKKEGISLYIETQFCFDHVPVFQWEERIRALGVDLPIHIGVAGPATLKTLLRFAHSSGIGPSMKFIVKQARNLSKLLTTQAPDQFIFGLSKRDEYIINSNIKKLHYYPFGGFEKTANWAKSLENDNFKILNENSFIIE